MNKPQATGPSLRSWSATLPRRRNVWTAARQRSCLRPTSSVLDLLRARGLDAHAVPGQRLAAYWVL